jgi:hypothetical protein
MYPTRRGIEPELARILRTIVESDQGFGHRQHLNLTFLAVRRYGMPAAVDKVRSWIGQIASVDGAPHKYHETITRAWVELVAHHVQADPHCAQFEAFARRHPRLLDKHLLTSHYRPATLAADHARRCWTEPDLLPFPWRN